MNYFLDTEFLEGTQRKNFFWKTKPTIDLISIGIVSEDGREYYAISKEFNIKEAWNRWQPRTGQGDRNYMQPREYWIRENVLLPIFIELRDSHIGHWMPCRSVAFDYPITADMKFTYRNFRDLIRSYGKSNKEIATEVEAFCNSVSTNISVIHSTDAWWRAKHKFYGYYADYDWVVFCWLFGNMVGLPRHFPMHCIDLKQSFDGIQNHLRDRNPDPNIDLKTLPEYPKQKNEHNALADAKWNLELYKFLNLFVMVDIDTNDRHSFIKKEN